MKQGVVKWFSSEKGYGFITPEGNAKDIFVHHSNINMSGFKTLSEGQRVSFETETTAKGPSAVNVSIID